MSFHHSPIHRRPMAALTLAGLLSLGLAGNSGASGAAAARARPHHLAATSVAAPASPWRWLTQLWQRVTAADVTGRPGGVLPTDDNGGTIDPNGKPKPSPTHP
jgi:hypothetical protein